MMAKLSKRKTKEILKFGTEGEEIKEGPKKGR
jgi:hypothetical protein